MFELFTAYEMAKNEKNSISKFIYIKMLKFSLKKNFFRKYRALVLQHIPVDLNSIDEFIQFHACTSNEIDINTTYTYINNVKDNGTFIVNVPGDNTYTIQIICYEDKSIKIDLTYKGKDINDSYSACYDINSDYAIKVVSDILLPAMYNYCVSYIYGSKSDLYI